MSSKSVKVAVGGRELSLSNLDKVLYPDAGFTKGDVIHYYASIAPYLLPHLEDRPLTFKRYPDGVEGKFFFEKNAPRSTPEWVPTARVPSPGSSKGSEFISHPLIQEVAALTWAANLAALELHSPLWRMGAGEPPCPPDLMVFDLDPGPPATIVECCEVAQLLVPHLSAEGYDVVAKTSGSKGLQLYVATQGKTWPEQSEWAHELAKTVEAQAPGRVVSRMTKSLREGKVLIDWSQNNPSKTTVSVYSLRARPRPTVSTPVTWAEVDACVDSGDPQDLVFEAPEVLERVQEHGDLFALLLSHS